MRGRETVDHQALATGPSEGTDSLCGAEAHLLPAHNRLRQVPIPI